MNYILVVLAVVVWVVVASVVEVHAATTTGTATATVVRLPDMGSCKRVGTVFICNNMVCKVTKDGLECDTL